MNKLKLTPLSAFMIQWVRETEQDELLVEFMDHLDFSAGDELKREVDKICDWYDEVLLNKKHFIERCINEELSRNGEEHLVIVLLAGNFPHALELLHENPDKINRVIEIDRNGMEEKQELYDRFFPRYSEKIKCISADISSKTILDLVSNLIDEYYHDMPSIILLDNATYLLKVSDLKNIISSFRSSGKKNTLILDSLRPFSKVCSELRSIPQNIYEVISLASGKKSVTPLEHQTLITLFNEYGGELKKASDLVGMEKLRMGTNRHFHKIDDSWLDCSVWQI